MCDTPVEHFTHRRFMNPRIEGQPYTPTFYEHVANIATHGTALFATFGLAYYLVNRDLTNDQLRYATMYGLASILLFAMSTLYHCVFLHGKHRRLRFATHIADRATIYVFIATSYMPWLYLKPIGWFGAQMRWVVWVLCLCGCVYQWKLHERYKLLEVLMYVFAAVFPALSVFSMYETSGVPLMLSGSVMFGIGVLFFRSDGRIPFAHAIWHLFVVAGAWVQYSAVLLYLMQK